MDNSGVVIIGAGLAGLACAVNLKNRGISAEIIEASDGAGGRARTDEVDGFLLDRGFQVLLEAYPEAKAILDYRALKLKSFQAGAIVRYQGKFHSMLDPWRNPLAAVTTAMSPVGSMMDKLRVEHLRQEVTKDKTDDVQGEASTTDTKLRSMGFSDSMIDGFFRPFFGGIFLQSDLQASSRMFEFLYRMFSEESAAIPRQGMGEMAAQLVRKVGAEKIRFNTRVNNIDGTTVHLSSGEAITASAIVVATDASTASSLLGEPAPEAGRDVACLYFAAPKSPVKEPLLVLNGDNDGPVNNLCVPSDVSWAYAPSGKSLISCTVLEDKLKTFAHDNEMETVVREQMQSWYGKQVKKWELLHVYRIKDALPGSGKAPLTQREPRVRDGVYICGDHTSSASINGALKSGRLAAEAIANELGERISKVS